MAMAYSRPRSSAVASLRTELLCDSVTRSFLQYCGAQGSQDGGVTIILGQSLLRQLDAILLLQLETKGLDQLWSDRRKHTLLLDCTVQHKQDSDCARNTDQLGHCTVTSTAFWFTILGKCRSPQLLLAILPGDFELVLKHDKVPFAFLVLLLLLERGAEDVKRSTARLNLVVTEEAIPSKTGENAVLGIVVGELGLGGDGPFEILHIVAGRTDNLGKGFLPGDGLLEVVLWLFAEQTEVTEGLYNRWVALE